MGHTIWGSERKISTAKKVATRVRMAPPTNPSIVLFGLSVIKGVWPIVTPQKYADVSLQATIKGTKKAHPVPNRISPPSELATIAQKMAQMILNPKRWY